MSCTPFTRDVLIFEQPVKLQHWFKCMCVCLFVLLFRFQATTKCWGWSSRLGQSQVFTLNVQVRVRHVIVKSKANVEWKTRCSIHHLGVGQIFNAKLNAIVGKQCSDVELHTQVLHMSDSNATREPSSFSRWFYLKGNHCGNTKLLICSEVGARMAMCMCVEICLWGSLLPSALGSGLGADLSLPPLDSLGERPGSRSYHYLHESPSPWAPLGCDAGSAIHMSLPPLGLLGEQPGSRSYRCLHESPSPWAPTFRLN